MRLYNPYSCPRCAHSEFGRKEGFGHRKGRVRVLCKAGKEPVEMDFDPSSSDYMTNVPPKCSDFELEGRK